MQLDLAEILKSRNTNRMLLHGENEPDHGDWVVLIESRAEWVLINEN